MASGITNKGFFICFIGIDGSGKTTQAKTLVDRMAAEGFKSQYVYNRFIPILIRPAMAVARMVFLRGKNMYRDYTEFSRSKKTLFKSRVLSSLYRSLLLFDYFFQTMLKVRIPLLCGKNLVCDRYIYDTVVTDLAVDLDYSEERVGKTLDNYFRFTPRPDLVVLLDVPEDLAFQRKDDIPSVDYVRERRQLYMDMAVQSIHESKLLVVDGSQEVDRIGERIWDRVALMLQETKVNHR